MSVSARSLLFKFLLPLTRLGAAIALWLPVATERLLLLRRPLSPRV